MKRKKTVTPPSSAYIKIFIDYLWSARHNTVIALEKYLVQWEGI